MASLDAAALLDAYDAQLRGRVPPRLPPSASVVRDGSLVIILGLIGRGLILYRDLGGLDGAALDELIARQVESFRGRDEAVEWKLHGHDRPADLPDRLRAAGFQPEDEETVVIAPIEAVRGTPALPDGVTLRDVTARADLDRIVALEGAVWGEDHAWLADALEEELGVDPDGLSIVVAEVGGEVVCAAWIRFEAGTEFATLWGGATLAEWRGRGIYRATVAHRANLAAERGFRFLETDASSDSRPILERLGFIPVTTTTPWVWSPPETAA